MTPLRVSPRNLGPQLLEDFCGYCYYYDVQMGFKLPFDRPMPGLMHNLDRFEKAIVDAHVAANDTLPDWLSELDCVSTVEFPAKLMHEYPEFDITLVGMPDAVFKRSNGKLCLVDYKTAKHKGSDDPFMPIYQAQLLGYAHLLESNGIGKVDSAALVYFENRLSDHSSDPLALITEQGFNVPFSVKIHEVEIDRPALRPLLKRLREFSNMTAPPEGREKCRGCGLLRKLFDLEQEIRNHEDVLRNRDQYFRQIMYPIREANRRRAKHAWQDSDEATWPDQIMAVQDYVPAAWDL